MARCCSWRAGAFRGRYHMLGDVLGDVLSARDGVGPEDLDTLDDGTLTTALRSRRPF